MRIIRMSLVVLLLACSVSALAQAPKVAQLSPSAGHNKRSITTRVYGADFAVAPVSVKLAKTGYPDIVAESVSVWTDLHLTCAFDLRSAPTKLYDMVVSNIFGADTLPGCFMVYSMADSPDVWIQSSVGSGNWYMYDVEVGDGDNDGELEVYGVNWDDTLYQFEWNGVTWDKTVVGFGDWYMQSVALGDGNADGEIEVYAANHDWNIYQYKYNGVTWARDTVGYGGEFMYGVALGDGDEDGEIEIYGANEDAVVYQYKWTGVTWVRDSVGVGGLAMLDVAVGDGNRDGEVEIYGADRNNRIYQFKWNGSGWTRSTVGQATDWMVAVAIGDGDGDELVEVYGASHDSIIYQFIWNDPVWEMDSLGSGGNYMRDVFVGDGNGDGEPEVYAANNDYWLYEFEWSGSAWDKTPAGAGTDFMAGAAVGDGNNDGKMELYGSNDDGNIYQFKSPSVPDIEVSDTLHDFGPVLLGDSLDWNYLVVSNRGTADLTIGGIIVDTAAYTAIGPPLPDTLVPDDSILVTVRFKPLAQGAVPGTLTVFSNDPDESPVFVSLYGEGFDGPDITFSDTSYDFGLVAVGDSADWTYLVLGNIGNEDLIIGGITSDNPVFSIVSPAFPDTVVPFDSVLVTVRFKPVSAGIALGTLTIFSNDPYESPAYVDVSGEGYIVSPDPDIFLSDTTYAFGLVAIGDSLDWGDLVIRNIGSQTLSVDSVLPDAADYLIVAPAFPQLLDQNDSVKVTTRFKPLAPGVRAGTLWVYSNDPDEPTRHVALTGEGYVGIEEARTIPISFYFGLKSNPVRDRPVFVFSLPAASHVLFEVYDVSGRIVSRPLAGAVPAGTHEVQSIRNLGSGVYFYSFESMWGTATGKFVLVH
jgi:hypothetical protein